jgi:hypothetical protein
MTMYTSDRAAAQEIPEFDLDEGDRAIGNCEDVENGKGANKIEQSVKKMI